MSYEIVRFKFKHPSEVIGKVETLEEAQEWCDREDTRGGVGVDAWFDGYRKVEDDDDSE